MSEKGTIFNIQSYSIHDGPGIRTVVFLKGCSLKCEWCSNPESQKFKPEIYYSQQRCMNCGLCLSICPNGAIIKEDNHIAVIHDQCQNCGACVEVCPTKAITTCGRTVSADEIVNEVNRDKRFMINSGGGVTFSGGEPFEQSDFLNEIAKKLKSQGCHIAVETSGCTAFENITKCLDNIDLLLYDLKFVSKSLHEKYTGFDNSIILENLKKVYGLIPTTIRIPIIPGINDTKEQLMKMIAMISDISAEAEVNLLPFHQSGKSKYPALGMTYKIEEIKPPEEVHMEKILRIFLEKGLKASIV